MNKERGGGDDKKRLQNYRLQSHILKFNMWLENADQLRINSMETKNRVSQIFINNKIKILLPNSAHNRNTGVLTGEWIKNRYNVYLYIGIVYICT